MFRATAGAETTYRAASPWGRGMGLKSKYNKERWEFIAQEPMGVCAQKTMRRKHLG